MRFKEVWSDWRGSRIAQQITLPGANVENGGSARSGAITFTKCNNRYLSWYCCANILELTEISLDDKLTDNAVDIMLTHQILSSSVTSCEHDDVVIVTLVTTAQIYWMEFPHPLTIPNKGVSILSCVTMDTIRGISHGVTLTVDTMTSSILSRRGASIVCNSKSGVVFMLSPHTGPGGNNVTTVEIATSNKGVMQRMWHGLISSSAAMATDSVIDLVLFSSDDDNLVAMASYHDRTLRLFSCQQQRVIMTYSLSDYISGNNTVADVVAMVRAEHSQPMKFALFLSLEDRSMVIIFTMTTSYDLHVIYSANLSPEYSLIRWQLGNKEIWMILSDCDGDTVVKHAVYKCGSSSVLMDVTMVTDPELMISDHLSPREAYLDHITLHYPSSVIKAVIKSMESNEMGSHDFSDVTSLRSSMCHLVEAEIQQQVLGSCGPQEYRQHQLIQWDRLLGYIKQYQDEQVRPPSGLLIDNNNGLVLLLGQHCVSVMIPYINPIDLVGMATVKDKGRQYFEPIRSLYVRVTDVDVVLQCVSMVTKMLTDDKKFLQIEFCFHDDFDIIAASLANDVIARGDNVLLAEFKERINDIQNVAVAMETLVNYFDPSCKDGDEADEDSVHVVPFYTGDVMMVTMVTAMRQLLRRRISLCQHLIIMFHLYKLVCSQYFTQPNHKVINSLSHILKCYHSIHWLTVTNITQPSSVDIDTTLGRLDISDRLPEQLSGPVTLMEFMLRGRVGNMVGNVVARRLPVSGRHNWRCIVPLFMDVTIETLWCSSWSLVCDLLLSNHQCLHAQTYLRLLPCKYHSRSLYQFYLAQSLLPCEPDKACDLFINAVAMGITKDDELYKHCHGNTADESCDPLLVYYHKVVSLMEQVSSPADHVILIVSSALKTVNDSVFRSLLFKQHLLLRQYEAAYNAMVTIIDSSRRMDCLRHFVTVLIDEHQWARLCSLPFSGMENEVEDTMEARARSLDINAAHQCYMLLYSYHVSHSNYRKGATVMYEAAHRTGIEAGGDLSTDITVQYRRQRDYYAVSLCCLKLCSHDYQWLVRPASNDKEDLGVMTYDDISKEYELVNAKCELLEKHPDATSELARCHMSSQEVMSLLIQHGLFDVAFQLGRLLQLPLDTIYDNLAARCVSLTKSFATIQKLKLVGNNQSDYSWQWVESNDPETTVNTKEMTVVDNAWLLLWKHLMTDDDCKKNQKCVARRIVAMGGTLPQWLIDHYKRSDAAGLLLLYINNNMLEEALLLAIEYIDAALGRGAEYFGIETTNCAIWLPHNTFGYLAIVVEGKSEKLELVEVYKQFMDKWNHYLTEISK